MTGSKLPAPSVVPGSLRVSEMAGKSSRRPSWRASAVISTCRFRQQILRPVGFEPYVEGPAREYDLIGREYLARRHNRYVRRDRMKRGASRDGLAQSHTGEWFRSGVLYGYFNAHWRSQDSMPVSPTMTGCSSVGRA